MNILFEDNEGANREGHVGFATGPITGRLAADLVSGIADRVPPVYSWLSRRGKDPLSTKAEDVRYF